MNRWSLRWYTDIGTAHFLFLFYFLSLYLCFSFICVECIIIIFHLNFNSIQLLFSHFKIRGRRSTKTNDYLQKTEIEYIQPVPEWCADFKSTSNPPELPALCPFLIYSSVSSFMVLSYLKKDRHKF